MGSLQVQAPCQTDGASRAPSPPLKPSSCKATTSQVQLMTSLHIVPLLCAVFLMLPQQKQCVHVSTHATAVPCIGCVDAFCYHRPASRQLQGKLLLSAQQKCEAAACSLLALTPLCRDPICLPAAAVSHQPCSRSGLGTVVGMASTATFGKGCMKKQCYTNVVPSKACRFFRKHESHMQHVTSGAVMLFPVALPVMP